MTDPPAMSCPVCRVPLTMSEREGVEIDFCPQCRGVWLDRGELDKILDRVAVVAPASPAAPPAPPPPAATPAGTPPAGARRSRSSTTCSTSAEAGSRPEGDQDTIVGSVTRPVKR